MGHFASGRIDGRLDLGTEGGGSQADCTARIRPILKDIVFAFPLKGYRLGIRYEDGVEGVVELGEILNFQGAFAPLKDAAFFSHVRVDPELGTV